jgi:ribosomal protein S18 acetylase RimI-like enzyme
MIAESEREGWRFIRRLTDEWTTGTNRFDRPGEALFVARIDGAIVGICGLNSDPYTADGTTGRIRRLYVVPAYRRRGIGGQLVGAVVAAATGRFQRLRVRTENPEAGHLYQTFGFQRMFGEAECTHVLNLIDTEQSAADRPHG